MFGLLRFYLAWMVVVTHISTVLEYVGGFALYSFYILSGYLMTLIMNQNYGYHVAGIKAYLLNRFLRIYPPYWFVAGLTLVALMFVPAMFSTMHPGLRVPESLHEILSNSFIFGLFPGVQPGEDAPMARLVPAAWALHVELCFYLLIGLFLGRFRILVVFWLVASVLYHWLALQKGWPRYAPVYAASLPFSMGAFLYHYKEVLWKWLPDRDGVTLLMLLGFIVFTLTVGFMPVSIKVIPFYANMLYTFVLILQLVRVNGRDYPRLKRADNFLGDLSYPIYLSHWLVATLTALWLGLDKSVELFVAMIVPLMLFSVVMKYVVDDPVETLRRAVARRVRAARAG